jgi:serine/threonine-protein kinase
MAGLPGHYEVITPLGQGPWGTSFRGRDRRNGRRVHLTVLRPEGPVRMLARRLAGLTHENLATVHLEGEDCLVLEEPAGVTVGRLIRQFGAFPEPEALDIAREAASGLGCLVRCGLGHGGVSPDTIVIGEGGVPVLRGLGPARELNPLYAAPELARGEQPDARSDVFSLGRVVQAMLVGSTEPAIPPEVRPATAQLLGAMLEPRWERRLPDLERVRDAIDRLLLPSG